MQTKDQQNPNKKETQDEMVIQLSETCVLHMDYNISLFTRSNVSRATNAFEELSTWNNPGAYAGPWYYMVGSFDYAYITYQPQT